MTEPLTRSAALTGFPGLARSLGLDPYRLIAEQGLPAGCLTDPDLRIPAPPVGRLLERAAELSGAMDFGLRLAEMRRLSNLGAVGFVIREQPTLRKAIEAAVSYSWAQNEALALRVEVQGDVAIVRDAGSGAVGVSRQGIELMFGVLALTVRRLVGQAWRPAEVAFSHSRPPDLSTHRRVFGVAPLFDQDFSGLVLDARDLDVEIAGADPEAARRAVRYLEMEATAPRGDIVAAVRELIEALLPTGGCTIEKVAAHLGVSRRTLHRQLAADGGRTFTGLLEQVRGELLERYRAGGQYSLTEIGERLGYGSLSAFSRWRRGRRVAAGP